MKKKIKSITALATLASHGQPFRFVCKDIPTPQSQLQKADLSTLKENESKLPKAIGPISRFNLIGSHKLLKDLPKKPRYTHSIMWQWEQWAPGGTTETQFKTVDLFRDCYQREETPPPSIEISKISLDGSLYFCSPELSLSINDSSEIVHVANLFIEIFGEWEIEVNDSIQSAKFKKVNWRFLPPGDRPFDAIMSHLNSNLGNSKRTKPVIIDRQKFIYSLSPNKVYIGEGGFRDYVAYEFEQAGLVVLESVKSDNALYVFDKNWEHVSKLTKKEIITNGHAKTRIIHTQDWKRKLKNNLDLS